MGRKQPKAKLSAQPGTMNAILAAIAALAEAQRGIDEANEVLPYLPEDYATAAEAVVTALVEYEGPVPFERAEAIALACRVFTVWREWSTSQETEWPPDDFYALRQRLDELVRFPSARTPSPKLLAERHTPVRQIAVIWGIHNSAGSPDVDRVERLIAGHEQLPDGWEAADARRAILDATAALEALRRTVAETMPHAEVADEADGSDGERLTPEQQAAALELLHSGLTPEEAAAHLDVDVALLPILQPAIAKNS